MTHWQEAAYSPRDLTYAQTLSFYALECYELLKGNIYHAADMQRRINILEDLFLNSPYCGPEFSFYKVNIQTHNSLLLRELYLSSMFMSFAEVDMEALPTSCGEASDKGSLWERLRSPFVLCNSANEMLSSVREREGVYHY